MKLKKFLNPQKEIDLIAQNGYSRIVGIDEAGKGCWAGPVAVGAYVYEIGRDFVKGVNDSKILTLKQRNVLFKSLKSHPHKVVMGEVEVIDSIGIGKTVELLISNLIEEFNSPGTYFLVDGQFSSKFKSNVKKIIDGDALFYSIAAASILAKVTRDNLIAQIAKSYPGYFFEKHKGYGTKQHREVLKKIGPCDLHRKSYEPIKKFFTTWTSLH